MANNIVESDKKRKKIILCIVIVLVVINLLVFGILFLDLSKYIWPEEPKEEENNGYQLSKDGTVTIDDITYKQKEDGNFIVISAEKSITSADIRSKINETDETNVNEIGEKAFEGCIELTGINIPSTITTINGYAFSGCNKLNTITLPYSVKEIGDSIFYECNNISSIKVVVANQNYKDNNGVLYDIEGKTLYAYPFRKTDEQYKLADDLENISNNVFRGFTKLKSVSLPQSVKSIGSGAFENCSNLESILISKNVETIEENAFNNCSEKLTIYGEKDSYAETYAKEKNITFKTSDQMPTVQTNNNEENVTTKPAQNQTETNSVSENTVTNTVTNTANVVKDVIEIE